MVVSLPRPSITVASVVRIDPPTSVQASPVVAPISFCLSRSSSRKRAGPEQFRDGLRRHHDFINWNQRRFFLLGFLLALFARLCRRSACASSSITGSVASATGSWALSGDLRFDQLARHFAAEIADLALQVPDSRFARIGLNQRLQSFGCKFNLLIA